MEGTKVTCLFNELARTVVFFVSEISKSKNV